MPHSAPDNGVSLQQRSGDKSSNKEDASCMKTFCQWKTANLRGANPGYTNQGGLTASPKPAGVMATLVPAAMGII
jgi:hypothetical protein